MSVITSISLFARSRWVLEYGRRVIALFPADCRDLAGCLNTSLRAHWIRLDQVHLHKLMPGELALSVANRTKELRIALAD